MSNHDAGHAAEKQTARYLETVGYEVLELNWRTPACEIDIVARKDGVIYFVEVKSRTSGRQGTGLEYITDHKIRKMAFAAEAWVMNHQWDGPYQLAAVGVDAGRFTFVDLFGE